MIRIAIDFIKLENNSKHFTYLHEQFRKLHRLQFIITNKPSFETWAIFDAHYERALSIIYTQGNFGAYCFTTCGDEGPHDYCTSWEPTLAIGKSECLSVLKYNDWKIVTLKQLATM